MRLFLLTSFILITGQHVRAEEVESQKQYCTCRVEMVGDGKWLLQFKIWDSPKTFTSPYGKFVYTIGTSQEQLIETCKIENFNYIDTNICSDITLE